MANQATIVVATNNPGKLKEFKLLLPNFNIISQSSLGIVPEEELGETFFENSLQKARVANTASGKASLGDDSGLIVPALNNLPGLRSARYSADPFPLIATGIFEGSVKTTMRGENGFGYDPMFYPKDSNFSLGEMDKNEKALLSHRGKAIQILKNKIQKLSSE